MRYDKLFSINIGHHYFSEKAGASFVIEPTSDCLEQLRRFSLIFKGGDDSAQVLFPVDEVAGDLYPLRPICEQLSFNFVLKSKDPYLISYSELKMDGLPQNVFHYSNIERDTDNPNLLDNNQLNTGEPGAEIKPDLIPVSPRFFKIEASEQTIRLINEYGDLVNEWDCFSSCSSSSSSSAELTFDPMDIDFDNWGNGYFYLVDDLDQEIHRFYADDKLSKARPFGILSLHVSPLVKNGFDFVRWEQIGNTGVTKEIQQRDFYIEIANRAVLWKYKVLNSSDTIKTESLFIDTQEGEYLPSQSSSSSQEITFSRTIEGNTAIFVSDDPIELFDSSTPDIELIVSDNEASYSLIRRLSAPDIKNLKMEGGQWCCEAIVYI